MSTPAVEVPASQEAVVGDEPPRATYGLRTAYLLVLVGLLGLVLWSASTPLPSLPTGLVAGLGLLVWAVIWMVGAIVTGARLLRRRPNERCRWLVVAPLLVAATVVLVAADVPIQARWRTSRGAFEDVVARSDPDLPRAQRRDLDAERGEIGAYEVLSVRQRGEAVIFTVADGGLFQLSGFAYLPDGPFPELGFAPPGGRLRHLEGDWYVWDGDW